MVSAVTTSKFGANNIIKTYLHVPGATSATVVNNNGGSAVWLDMSVCEVFAVDVMNAVSASSSGPTLIDIVGADDTSGTNVTTIISSGTLAITTVGPNVFLEVMASQVREVSNAAGFNFRYVSARITTSNSSDKQSVTFIQSYHRAPQSALTAAAVAY